MHRIKREARYQAWLESEGESQNYNPFRKVRRTQRLESEEPATQDLRRPRRVRSESALRRTYLDPADSRVQRASTTPVRLSSSPADGEIKPDSASAHDYDRLDSEKVSPDDQRRDDVTVNSNGADSITRARFRSRFKGMLGKKTDYDSSEDVLVKPEHFTVASQIRATLLNSWVNLLLLAVPAGFAVRYAIGYSITTFIVNFLATIPLVLLVGFGADEIQIRVGITLGSLISVSASNIAQFITSVLLLKSRQILVLRTGLIGGILCCILLVLGLSFFFGGFNRVEQHYNLTLAHTSANMLSLASTSLLVPTVSQLLKQSSDVHVAKQSRGAAILLLIVYAAFITFQLKTHRELWNAPDEKTPKRKPSRLRKGEAMRGIAQIGAGIGASAGGEYDLRPVESEEEIDDIAIPSVPLSTAIATLVISTTLLAFNTDFAVNSIDQLSQRAHISKNFIGLVLLPLLNNVDPGPILFAVRDRVTVTVSITVGKCLQTALLITPLMVIVGWALNIDAMTLYFDGFEVASIFASVILLNYLIIDGKSTWVQGVLLVADWGMIALAAFFADV
ncbi:MAG: hypothetical protein Q9227_005723 [Pyrenula ochraceoflavens]